MSQADFVFEYLNPNGSIYYQAIFKNKLPKNISTSENLNSIFLMPKFNYETPAKISSIFSMPATSIYITFNPPMPSNMTQVSSDFIYSDNKYYHYKNKSKDIDKNNNNPICVNNVIVQFVDKPLIDNNLNSIMGQGKGYLFSGGKGIEIKWNKEESNPIKILDSNNNPIFITKGSIWWVIIDEDSSIVFN